MCGITGYFSSTGFSAPDAENLVTAMANALEHRGPDDYGTWVDANVGIALAHRRLSILDLSPAGHQPMVSESGRYVLVFNGEIYNHIEIRSTLSEATWRGHSDTETLLAAISRWGLERTLPRLVGMFSLALWDREDNTLSLARDRTGEKPLFYGWQGSFFVFGSELKALRRHHAFSNEIERDVLPLFLRHGYIPAPYSIFRGIRKLMPGTYLKVPITTAPGNIPDLQSYWSLRGAWHSGQTTPFQGTEDQAISQLESLLSNAISLQMVADVPLGALLSGGIDSSTVTALMQARSSRRVRTFTIGFAEENYNEAEHAKAIAKHLGTDHTELYVSPRDALDVIPILPRIYDEPFADPSAIPMILLSRLARHHVTVSLTGDGGDELFGGYSRYLSTARHWSRIRRIPMWIRMLIASGVTMLPPAINRYPALPRALQSASDTDFYRTLSSQWPDPTELVRQAQEPPTLFSNSGAHIPPGHFVSRMMYADTLTYMPDAVLCKVDRAAMSVGLETRVPLLDHRIMEFAYSLPISVKIRDLQGKWILREVLKKYVPDSLTDRPKRGFGVPLDVWLRGPLRDWAETMLSENRLRNDGYFAPKAIQRRWQQHLSGKYNWQDPLWLILMFQAWIDEQSIISRRAS